MSTRTQRAKKVKKAKSGMTFVQACQVGADMFFDFRKRGIDVEDEEEVFGKFEAEIKGTDVPEELRGAAFASFLDQRECELGWD